MRFPFRLMNNLGHVGCFWVVIENKASCTSWTFSNLSLFCCWWGSQMAEWCDCTPIRDVQGLCRPLSLYLYCSWIHFFSINLTFNWLLKKSVRYDDFSWVRLWVLLSTYKYGQCLSEAYYRKYNKYAERKADYILARGWLYNFLLPFLVWNRVQRGFVSTSFQKCMREIYVSVKWIGKVPQHNTKQETIHAWYNYYVACSTDLRFNTHQQ